jgi:hypothetical protein
MGFGAVRGLLLCKLQSFARAGWIDGSLLESARGGLASSCKVARQGGGRHPAGIGLSSPAALICSLYLYRNPIAGANSVNIVGHRRQRMRSG